MSGNSAFSGGDLLRRSWYMLGGWGAIGAVYTLTSSKDQTTAHMLQPGVVDHWFGFDPLAIWPYMSFFLIVPLGYLAAAPMRAAWLSRAMIIAALGAALVFVLFPTTMVYPAVTQQGLSAELLKLLMRYDSLQNCLPSLHVTLTALTVLALRDRERPVFSTLVGLWGLAIILSILVLRRHQFVDLLAGLVLVVPAAALASWSGPQRAAPGRPAE
jgi:membrane-associated phospholipid phosphatase